jgi:hypothetical protein
MRISWDGFSLLILESKEFECGCSENLDSMLSSGSPFTRVLFVG